MLHSMLSDDLGGGAILEAVACYSEFRGTLTEREQGCPPVPTPLGLAALAVFCNPELIGEMGNPYGFVSTGSNDVAFCFWNALCEKADTATLQELAWQTSETLMKGRFAVPVRH